MVGVDVRLAIYAVLAAGLLLTNEGLVPGLAWKCGGDVMFFVSPFRFNQHFPALLIYLFGLAVSLFTLKVYERGSHYGKSWTVCRECRYPAFAASLE